MAHYLTWQYVNASLCKHKCKWCKTCLHALASMKRRIGDKDISYLHDLPDSAVTILWDKIKQCSRIAKSDPLHCQLDTGGCKTEPYPRHALAAKDRAKLLPKEKYFPQKFQANHIALLAEGVRPPTTKPPSPPDWPREKKKAWRWVASHLCHKPNCVNHRHLVWEADWKNRTRDNCLVTVTCPGCNKGVTVCQHDPPCLAQHKATYTRALKKAGCSHERHSRAEDSP